MDPATAAQVAQARAAETRAEIERARALAQLRREQDAAQRAAARESARLAREAKRERTHERRRERAEQRERRNLAWRRFGSRLRLLAPLLIVNSAAVYGQIAYAYESIAPQAWLMPARLGLSVLFAAAVESIAIYVGWHAHDALLSKATATAARLRRASYALAGIVAGINYAHFAGPSLAPTAAAVAFGLLSLLSPWLWGLHTRRAQHVQLLDEGAVDRTGAVFSAERRRAFPLRTWGARRWSIEHNITDPAAAWAGYNADRLLRQLHTAPTGRGRTAWAVVSGQLRVAPHAAPLGVDQVDPAARSANSESAEPPSRVQADPTPVVRGRTESGQGESGRAEPSRGEVESGRVDADRPAQSRDVVVGGVDSPNSQSSGRAESEAPESSRPTKSETKPRRRPTARPEHVKRLLAAWEAGELRPNAGADPIRAFLGTGMAEARAARDAARAALNNHT